MDRLVGPLEDFAHLREDLALDHLKLALKYFLASGPDPGEPREVFEGHIKDMEVGVKILAVSLAPIVKL